MNPAPCHARAIRVRVRWPRTPWTNATVEPSSAAQKRREKIFQILCPAGKRKARARDFERLGNHGGAFVGMPGQPGGESEGLLGGPLMPEKSGEGEPLRPALTADAREAAEQRVAGHLAGHDARVELENETMLRH